MKKIIEVTSKKVSVGKFAELIQQPKKLKSGKAWRVGRPSNRRTGFKNVQVVVTRRRGETPKKCYRRALTALRRFDLNDYPWDTSTILYLPSGRIRTINHRSGEIKSTLSV